MPREQTAKIKLHATVTALPYSTPLPLAENPWIVSNTGTLCYACEWKQIIPLRIIGSKSTRPKSVKNPIVFLHALYVMSVNGNHGYLCFIIKKKKKKSGKKRNRDKPGQKVGWKPENVERQVMSGVASTTPFVLRSNDTKGERLRWGRFWEKR